MRRHLRLFAVVVTAALALLAAMPGIASAHDQRDIAGKFHFVVGFLSEPPITGQPNGIDLTITDLASKQPVEGAEQTLKAQIIAGGATRDVTVRPRFGMPGKYTASVIPTKAGAWKFRFTGSINGTSLDDTFESGPGRFNDVQPAESLEFPTTIAPPLDVANDASMAKTMAIIGIVVGAVGVLLGGAGLAYGLGARRRRLDAHSTGSVPRTA